MDNPLVSISIPCYNAEHTIKDTIFSILNQTYTNFEIIISDNKSTDNTISVIKSIPDSRIRLYENDSNIGIIGNFQKSLEYANGIYVKVVCADDILSTDCIQKQVDTFTKHVEKNISLVISEKKIINEENRVLFIKRFPGKGGIYDGLSSIKKTLLYGTNIFGEPGCVMFKNEIAKLTTGFIIENELTYVVDLNFYCQLLKHGNLFVIKEPLFSFRIIKTSGTASFKWKQAVIFNNLIDKYHKENFINISLFSRIICKIMSWIMCLGRNIIFKFAN